MAKTFRSWDVDQGWLLPPSVHEFVPPGHLAHFVRDTVREALDLSAILDTYTEERGFPPYHPGMMVALLLYGYSRGLYSSRQLARACEERVDVMAVTRLLRRACAGRWRALRGEDGGPPDRAQRNFTDPDSRILPTRDGFVQGYNGQIAVDAAHQVIVAHRLVTTSADYRALLPLLDDLQAHLGRKPREVSGDAGFATEANLAALKARRIRGYLPPGRARHGEAHAAGRRKLTKRPLMSAMAQRLKRAGRRSRYRLRKQVVEPVFGQIKHARGFRQFLLRGLDQVRAEWAMICTVHNLLKLAHATGR
jgi:Transposase DDE domain/Transposase domain (DUF772)